MNRDTIKDIIENKNKSEQEVIDAAIDKVKLRQENNNFFDEIQEYRKEIKEILKLK